MESRLEFFVEPFTEGRPGRHVIAALEAVADRGLEIEMGAFASIARGDLDALIEAAGPLLRSAVEAGAARISLQLSADSNSAGPNSEGIAPTGNGLGTLHDALARMINGVEREIGAPLVELSREHKQAAVRMLDDQGAFLLRKAVDDVADAMGVSRITIYNYLNADKEA